MAVISQKGRHNETPIIIWGNVVGKVEYKKVQCRMRLKKDKKYETSVTKFCVAYHTERNSNNQKISLYAWCVAWGKWARLTRNLISGDMVMVAGRLEVREFRRKDGTTELCQEIMAQFVAEPVTYSKYSRKRRKKFDDEEKENDELEMGDDWVFDQTGDNAPPPSPPEPNGGYEF